MTVSNTPGANPSQAALERQRLEEERRRQEEEARRRQEEAQRQVEAQKQAQQQQPQDRGFFGNLEKLVVEGANGKLAPAAAQKEQDGIKADLAAAKTPEDLQKVADRAATLAERAKVSDDPEVRKQADGINALNDRVKQANEAAGRIEAMATTANGTPAQQADQAAALLSRPKELTEAVASAKALAGSPLGDKLKAEADQLARAATPANLARQLQADPDLSHYPPTMAKNLAAMRAIQDPDLNKALDAVGKDLLDNPGTLSYDAIQKNPDLVRLAQNAAASDPAYQGKMDQVVHDLGNELLRRDLGDKKGEKDVKAAMEQFQHDLVALAQTGMDPGKLATAAADVLQENHETLEKHVSDGEDHGHW